MGVAGPVHTYLDAPVPLAMAHRGGATYGPNRGIENTLRAFATAIDLGYRYLETDVRCSRDGVPVAVHDDRLDRLCGVPRRVADLDWDDLSRLRVGGREPLARLDDVLATFAGVRLNVDVKADDAVAPILAAVRAARAADRVCLATFSDRRMRRLRRVTGRPQATSLATGEVAVLRLGPVGRLRAFAARGGGIAAQVPLRSRGVTVTTPALIRHAHELGLQVHVWGVEDEATMHWLLDLGVDGLIADRIDLLGNVLRDRRGTRSRRP